MVKEKEAPLTRKNSQNRAASGPAQKLNPGDEAPPGTPGTGEDMCPQCHGKGRMDGSACPRCGGTGRIVEGIGGA